MTADKSVVSRVRQVAYSNQYTVLIGEQHTVGANMARKLIALLFVPCASGFCQCTINSCGEDMCQGDCSATGFDTWCRESCQGTGQQAFLDKGACPCFSKESTTACRVDEAAATPTDAFSACFTKTSDPAAARVPMADLRTGDRVLTSTDGSLSTTRVVVNQHASADTKAEMITLHMANGRTALSLTPSHAIYVDGELVAASDAKVGSLLTTAEGKKTKITRVVRNVATIINPVTTTGTILASDHGPPVLAASHPFRVDWLPVPLAPLLVASPTCRAVANAAMYLVGDVVDFYTFIAVLFVKLSVALLAIGLAKRAMKKGRLNA